MIRIALINPIDKDETPDYIPTGLCYLSSFFKKFSKLDCEIKIFNLSWTDVSDITNFHPDYVGITAYTHSFTDSISIISEIKSKLPTMVSIIGGPHITMAPWSMTDTFDYAVIGEGERTFLELIESLNSKSSISGVKGIQYFLGGKLHKNEPSVLVNPMDKIPFPDREIVPDIESVISADHAGWFNKSNTRSLQVSTSRGCPFQCIFCQPKIMWSKFRMHSPVYVVNELADIYDKYNLNTVLIEDDLFTGKKSNVKKIIELLESRNLLGKISYYVAARTRQIDDEWVALFKKLGVVKVEFGIESGSDRIASYLKNSKESKEVNKRAISLLNDAGISVFAAFIAGAPDETESDLLETFEMVKWIKGNFKNNTSGINIATPLPGTGLWKHAVEKGLIDQENFNWDRLSTLKSLPEPQDNIIYLNEHMPQEKMIKMIKKLHMKMYIGSPREFVAALPRRTKKVFALIKKKVIKR